MLKSTTIAAGFLLAVLMAGTTDCHGGDQKPNIIFILVDDIGRDMYGCYGSDNQTPNIDKLASKGVRFETAWGCALCTPSRMELLTGMYPYRSGWTQHHDVPRWGGKGFDPDKFVCVSSPLKKAGYTTAIAGKWQINALRSDPQIMQKHGFDQYCLWTGVEKGNPPSDQRYWDAFLEINGKRSTHKDEFGPEITQKFVIDFINNQKAGPFFLYYPMISVHSPLEPLPDEKGKRPAHAANSASGGLAREYVRYVDRQVGQITDTLERLGIANNTVLIFSGDNGTAYSGGKMNGVKTPNAKGAVNDMGVHVPLIIYAPTFSTKPIVTDALVDFTDLYPTFIELAGAGVPAGVTIDGRSLVPILQGKETESKSYLYSQLKDKRIVRDKRWIYHSNKDFYDLKADPFEKNNLIKSADPEVVEARMKLSALMEALPADGPPPFVGFRGTDTDKEKSGKGQK